MGDRRKPGFSRRPLRIFVSFRKNNDWEAGLLGVPGKRPPCRIPHSAFRIPYYLVLAEHRYYDAPMIRINDICDFLEQFAPLELAAEWDNVGLLVGDREAAAERVMTCLTVTPDSAGEAIAENAQLIVTHHPLPFRPLSRLTRDTTPGRLLLDLIGAGVAVYSPHTAFDSAAAGINQRLAEGLRLKSIAPLVPLSETPPGAGTGRFGIVDPASTVGDVAQRLKEFVGVDKLQVTGNVDRAVHKVAVACGSAGQFLADAQRLGCDLLVTGETSFHTCLEAEATVIAVLLTGHFASERFAVERLAEVLAQQFPKLTVWPSRCEKNPLQWI
jgi:dinuclear metal center YbgI/SA1388 family protein